jgi:hypothetical protein
VLTPLLQRGDLLGQVPDPRAARAAFHSVAPVKALKVIVDRGISRLDELGQ